ncbi:uncharacterized protein [Palaemon carinicauda]|uniref:uncharacterized protein n=1 Tax=Palaemon carinicauda TaxID=392227 RepID=UPI0035B5F200
MTPYWRQHQSEQTSRQSSDHTQTMGEGQGVGEGSGRADSTCIGWGILWFLLLIVAFWVAGFCCFFYIVLNMFAACAEGLNPACEFFLKGLQLTGFCAQHMIKGTPIGEAFK